MEQGITADEAPPERVWEVLAGDRYLANEVAGLKAYSGGSRGHG